MEISLIALVGIALGTMFFGYFFGLFEGRGQGYRSRKKDEPPDHDLQLLAEKQSPSPAVIPAGERVSGSKSWLELAGDADGQPRMDLDGQHVNTAKLTPAQHRRLIELMIMMRPWLEAASQATEAATDAKASAPLPPKVSQSAGFPRAEKGMAPSGLPASTPGSAGLPAPGEVGAPTGMVAQIDTILQARLQGTTLGSLGIRLAESLNGGAIVFVGRQSYAGVADVPDARVQAAIREAIAEWEKRFTPG